MSEVRRNGGGVNVAACKLPKMCHNKRGYWLETCALQAIQGMRAQGIKARTYKCPNCPKWHITTKP